MSESLCECGCGGPTTIYCGKPRRFIHGHHRRGMPRNLHGSWVEGGVGFIRMRAGRCAMVDAVDLPAVQGHTWTLLVKRYAARCIKDYDGRREYVLLHRLIAGAKPGEIVDHINGNGLDNRRANLRVTTQAMNTRNRVGGGGRSRFKGISFCPKREKWVAEITVNYKKLNLGAFATEVEAAQVYNDAARLYHGEFARLNNIEEGMCV